ncbi:MAG: CRTAC1 family protein [Planctomycetaceae bacterium]
MLLIILGCSKGPTPPVPSEGVSGPTKSGGAASSRIRFEDVTLSSGVHFQYRNGEEAGEAAILEAIGGGVGLFDLDGDGNLDLCFPGGGHYSDKQADGKRDVLGWPHAIFRNDGEWHFTDVTAFTGATAAPYYSHGTAAADYDNDGFCDLLITGYGGVLLLHNQGDGTLEVRAKPAGMTDSLWSSSAAWGDFNNDGSLDVYIAHYVNWSFDNHPFCPGPKVGLRETCPPRDYLGQPDVLYFSNGDGTFRDVSQVSGLQPDGKGLGVMAADFDLDGDVDIYVGNDTVANFLYRNNGNGQFEETGLVSGTALNQLGSPDGSMGVDVGDFNLDGRPDLWVVNFERESIALYRNDGNCLFRHVSQGTGVTAVGALYVGWGTAFCDFDNDGDEDTFVSNGHAIRYPENAPVRQQPLLFENLKGQRLENVASTVGPYFREPHQGRGSAAGDLDRDGDLDLVVSCLNEPAALLSNVTPSNLHWISLRLIGRQSPRLPIGAIVKLQSSRGEQMRQVKGGTSYGSTVDSRLCFGLGADAKADGVVIQWPSGETQTLPMLDGDRAWVIIEQSPPVIDR